GNIVKKYFTTEINRTGPESPVYHNDPYMDTPYTGDSASIIYTEKSLGSFGCIFDVFFYPLDRQKCTINFTIASGQIDITDEFVRAEYSGNRRLNAFEITEVGVYVRSYDEDDVVEINFTLVRLPMHVLVVTFVPSLMILAIGYATLYLENSLQQDRLTVSLSSLLVLYTLFNQTSSILPKTSYVTMVDFWFLFCISMLFGVII
ncbi:unnamed protein product, partial [Meganyctiphanes norvegica]